MAASRQRALVPDPAVSDQPPMPGRHRRPRYPGRNPRAFHEKYKELDPTRYPEEALKVRAAGKTPAGAHVPIMPTEVLAHLGLRPGDVAVDCTFGGGGHARAIIDAIQPGGRLIALDADPLELPKTEARFRAEGIGPEQLTTYHANFAALPQVLATLGVPQVDAVLADLGVSSMQFDNPDRGFSYKGVGPLDMRMNPRRGEPASALVARLPETELAAVLEAHADEPHAALIARLLKTEMPATTHAAERAIRTGLEAAMPRLDKSAIKMSIRRTFQALRIAVNDEFGALDALLRALSQVLRPGGRVVILTFHSGEDRRVKKAFQAGQRSGLFSAVATEVVRSSKAETFANRRAASAKLRWAIRAETAR